MQTPVAIKTNVRSFFCLGMDAAIFAQVTVLNQPYTAEISIEIAYYVVGNFFEPVFKRSMY